MKALHYILLLTVAFTMSFCGKKSIPQKHTSHTKDSIVHVHDSVYVTVIKRDTFIKVERDTVTVNNVIECDSNNQVINGSFKQTSGRATVKVDIKDGKITATAICDSLEKQVEIRDKVIKEMKSTIAQMSESLRTKTTEYVEVKYIPWYVQTLMWVGIVLGSFQLGKIILNRIKIL